MAPAPDFALSRHGRSAVDQPISYLIAQAVANPRVISLAAGLVDYDTLPCDEVAELMRDILTDPSRGRKALQYGTTEGLAELRRVLYEHMAALDGASPDTFPGSADDVIVSTGSQQLLHVLTDLLVDPGDIVITAWPSYFVYTGALCAFGATVRSVDMDDRGMDPQGLERLLGQIERDGDLGRVKIVYVCSYHQNPTGLTLAVDRRAALLDVVRRHSKDHRILLIEDAAYRELTYGPPEGPPEGLPAEPGAEGKPTAAPPSIKSFDDDHTHVALLQTFSKPFAPGLKTGYGLLPRELVEPVLLQKGGRDFGSANLCQHVLLEAMKRGVYARHVERLCRAYTAKRDAMLDALAEHMPPEVTWTKPSGGLYVWLTLPEEVDTRRGGPLFEAKMREGVLAVPGEYCYPNDPTRTWPRNHLRLSFGTATIGQIRLGVQRLASAMTVESPK